MKYEYGYYWMSGWKQPPRIARYDKDGWVLLDAVHQEPCSLRQLNELDYKVIERIQESAVKEDR